MHPRPVLYGTSRGRTTAAVLALGVLAAGCAPGERTVAPDLDATLRRNVAASAIAEVRISEFHYDNSGTDANERIEISAPAGTTLAGWTVVLYNGSGGVTYNATGGTGPIALGGVVAATCGSRGVVVVNAPGLQNGAPDGLALVDATGKVVEFLSYEGAFAATNGPAAGMTSIDVGVAQAGDANDPANGSLQRDGAGALWKRTQLNTFGACNDDREAPPAAVARVGVTPAADTVSIGMSASLAAVAFDAAGRPIAGTTFRWATSDAAVATVDANGVVTGAAVGIATITAAAPNNVIGSATITVERASNVPAGNVRVTELHYDNEGTDSGEMVELEGDAGGSLAGWSIAFYNRTPASTSAQVYYTLPLAGTFGSACGTRGVLSFAVPASPGIQNGSNDGFAVVNAAGQVVEFLSYEGSFTATEGPAAGMTATDIGVDEDPAPPAGRSLQRAGNGTWFGPFTNTFGACNLATPPAPQTGITFSGRLPSDAALPVGYQDQLFATLRDANTGTTVPTTFTWSSETPMIASIDARGVVTATAAGTAVIRATAADGTTGTTTLATEVAPLGNAALYRDPLAFGVPLDGTSDDELRITRDQYTLSYNKARGTSNWIAYHLSRTVRGDLPGYRCDCFSVDPVTVDAGQPGITTADYTGSGFDRGHMVRSNDRELARGDQATTYYMSNIVPQYAAQNQGRWGDLESHLQTVAEGAGEPEIYIFTGPRGVASRIASGRIAVPTHTWKVAVVLPKGMTPQQVNSASDLLEVIAVDMPNVADLPRDGNWQAHKTTVDAIEAATGYDLLSALPDRIERVIESGVAPRAPKAVIAGAEKGLEGETLAFDANGSTDEDLGAPLNDALSFEWAVAGKDAGVGETFSYTFADNGTYAIRLIAADLYGKADTVSRMVTIANVAPALQPIAAGAIDEGETYTGSVSFTDPGTDSWSATVDYGDGSPARTIALGTAKSLALSHRYLNRGSYTVTVQVTETDPEQATDVATTTVAVGDVKPAVAAFAGATILRGETYQSSGTFTGADVDRFTASVSYGDGTPTAALTLTGRSFSLSHTYAESGVFTVRVAVTDEDESVGDGSATVTVKSAAQGTEDLKAEVNALFTGGEGPRFTRLAAQSTAQSGSTTLSDGETKSLLAKLDAALASLARRNGTAAASQLRAFINEIEALERSGRLATPRAARVIEYANRVIRAI